MLAATRTASRLVVLDDSVQPEHMTSEELQTKVVALQKRHDELVSECSRSRHKIDTLRKRAATFENKDDIESSRNGDGVEIAQLEVELEEVTAASRDMYIQRKTYEQIVHRLKEEGTGYWHELGQLDQTQKAKEHDFSLLQLMLKDASHVRDVAKQELTKVDEAVAEERRQRHRALQERRRKLETRQEAARAHERRHNARLEAMTAERLEAQRRSNVAVTANSLEAEREQIAHFEAQFAQIKDVMGAESVSEIIDMFTSQEETHATLEGLIRESQEKIDALLGDRSEAKKKVEDAKYTNRSDTMRRGVVCYDAKEHATATLQQNLSRTRNQQQRLKRVNTCLVEARVALDHLSHVFHTTAQLPASIEAAAHDPAQLDEADPDAAAAAPSDSAPAAAPPTELPLDDDEGLAASLAANTEKLIEMYRFIVASGDTSSEAGTDENDPAYAHAFHAMLATEGAISDGGSMVRDRAAAVEAIDPSAKAELFPIFKGAADNLRIKEDDQQDEEEDEHDEEDPDNPTDPVMDREAVKKQASALVKRRGAKTSKKGKTGKSGKGGDDEAEGRPASAQGDSAETKKA